MSGNGEKQGAREAIDRMVKQMTDNGANRDYAYQKAREAAIKHERKNEKR
jgi:hypothetical protein